MFVYQRLLGKVFFCHFLTAFPKETGSAEEPFAAIPLPQQCMSRGQSRKLPWPQQFNVCEDLIEGWKDRSVKECKGILDFGRSWQGPSDFFSCNPFNISSRGQCPRAAETGHNLILPGFLHMLRYFPVGLKLMSFALDFPLLCPLIQTFYSKTAPAATTHCTDALAVYAVWTTKKNHTRLNISTCVKT